MRAEDLLPDHINQAEIGGVTIRKGTVGAFLFNAKILSDPASTAEDRATAERDIVDGVPALRALGLFDVLQIRDEQLRALVGAQPDHR
jgi:uncharacterized protein